MLVIFLSGDFLQYQLFWVCIRCLFLKSILSPSLYLVVLLMIQKATGVILFGLRSRNSLQVISVGVVGDDAANTVLMVKNVVITMTILSSDL